MCWLNKEIFLLNIYGTKKVEMLVAKSESFNYVSEKVYK